MNQLQFRFLIHTVFYIGIVTLGLLNFEYLVLAVGILFAYGWATSTDHAVMSPLVTQATKNFGKKKPEIIAMVLCSALGVLLVFLACLEVRHSALAIRS